MSLLLEALKKAEKAKEEAQRRASGEPQTAEAGEPRTVVTRDKLPDVSTPLEIVTDDLTPGRATASPTPSRSAMCVRPWHEYRARGQGMSTYSRYYV